MPDLFIEHDGLIRYSMKCDSAQQEGVRLGLEDGKNHYSYSTGFRLASKH